MSSTTRRIVAALVTLLCALATLMGVTAENPATASSGAAPIRAAFYYPWFSETWHAGDHYHPSLGHYSSDDAAVIDTHFAAMKYGGMDAAISSWWGQGQHSEQTRFPAELRAAAAHGMGVAPYYEKEGGADTPLATIRSDLAYLKAYEQANPAGFLHVDGKPVIFVYNAAAATSTCADVTKWKQATNGFADWYVNLKVFSGYKTCADQPSSWHQYGPATETSNQSPYSYTVSPGYWEYDKAAGVPWARNPANFAADLKTMAGSGATWQLVTTFNEWGEGTAVESATEWPSASGYGAYLDAMHNALAPAATPRTVTLTATEDAATNDGALTTNYRTATALGVDGSPVRRAWLKFNLPGKPTAASLEVTTGSGSASPMTVNAAPSTWTEGGLTSNDAPALGSALGSEAAVPAGVQTITLDPAGLTAGDNTIVLSRTNATAVSVKSRESTTPPKLTITYDTTSSSTPTSTATPTPTATATPTPTSTPTPTPSPSNPPAGAVTKALVFVEENHSLDQMKTGMPYTFSLAKQYGYATAYKAIRHPSLPNYLAIAGGQTYGVTDDNPPSSHPLPGQSVFGQAIAAGRTAKTYADTMSSNCQLTSSGRYAVKHNPWAYYTASAERSGCNSFDVPVGKLATDAAAGNLPNVGMVVPDLCNDAHDCSLATADSWFQARMKDVFAGPDWKSGHLAVILTADEDDSSQSNTVLTVVIHPSQNGNVVATPLNHYSLTRLLEDVGHASSYLNNAATATNMATAFGLTIG